MRHPDFDPRDPVFRAKLDRAFGKHKGLLNKVCRHHLRGFGRQQVEEIVQETLLTAWRRLPEYRPDRPFRVWLVPIARNHCFNVRRKMRDSLTEDGLLADEEPVVAEQLTALMRQERETLVREAAQKVLDPQEQLVVEYRFVYEYPQEMVAELLGMEDKDEIRKVVQRCKRRLARELKDRLERSSLASA